MTASAIILKVTFQRPSIAPQNIDDMVSRKDVIVALALGQDSVRRAADLGLMIY